MVPIMFPAGFLLRIPAVRVWEQIPGVEESLFFPFFSIILSGSLVLSNQAQHSLRSFHASASAQVPWSEVSFHLFIFSRFRGKIMD